MLTCDHTNLAALAGELERAALSVRQIAVIPDHDMAAQARLEGPARIAFIRTMLRKRRDFENRLGNEFFADGSRDMLLDLYASELEGRRVFVSDLGLASAVPATTALRQMAVLTEQGLILRRSDPRDKRKTFMELSDDARRNIAEWLDGTVSALHSISYARA